MMTISKLSIIIISAVIVSAVIIMFKTNNMPVIDPSNFNTSKIHSIFQEEFSENSLAPKWEIIRNWNGTISVSDGALKLSQGTHKRINSSSIINDNNSTVFLTGRLLLTGYYQKFGININGENPHNGIGVYFDTFCPQNILCKDYNSTLPFGSNPVYLFVKEKNIDVYKSKATITSSQFHVLQIVLSPSDIAFFIDEHQVGRTKYHFSGPIIIGIWNDRSPEMQADWITVGYK